MESMPRLAPQGSPSQRGHHSFAEGQHQAEQGAKRKKPETLKSRRAAQGAPSGASEVAVGGQEGCARPPGAPQEMAGGAACRLRAVAVSAAASAAQHKPSLGLMGWECPYCFEPSGSGPAMSLG